MKTYTITIAVLFILIVLTALSLVYIKHKNRTLFTDLQSLYKVQIYLDEEWGRLLLEQSTVLSHGKVERIARKKLGMRQPNNNQIVVIR